MFTKIFFSEVKRVFKLKYFYLIDPTIVYDINKNFNMINFLIKF
jgi:hypothetical protein